MITDVSVTQYDMLLMLVARAVCRNYSESVNLKFGNVVTSRPT